MFNLINIKDLIYLALLNNSRIMHIQKLNCNFNVASKHIYHICPYINIFIQKQNRKQKKSKKQKKKSIVKQKLIHVRIKFENRKTNE